MNMSHSISKLCQIERPAPGTKMSDFTPSLLFLAILGTCFALAPPSAAFSRDPAPVFVNEIHYDNRGADRNEAVEIAGPADTDLGGWRLMLYNGSDGSDYFTHSLSGRIPDQDQGFGTVLIGLPTTGLQNGAPDGLALVDATGQVVQLLSYEGQFRASSGPAAGMDSTDIGVSEPGSTAEGHSLQLTGEGRVYQDFAWSEASPSSYGAPNPQQTFVPAGGEPVVACPAPPEDGPMVEISEVQGPGATSPLVDAHVTIQGIVTASFQADDALGGFYLQDPGDDRNPVTSEGVFVQATDPELAVGQPEQVTGRVAELFGQTVVGHVQELDTCGEAADVTATAVELGGDVAPDFERLEGMLVIFPQELAVTGSQNLGRFGELDLSVGGRLSNPCQATPGSDPSCCLTS